MKKYIIITIIIFVLLLFINKLLRSIKIYSSLKKYTYISLDLGGKKSNVPEIYSINKEIKNIPQQVTVLLEYRDNTVFYTIENQDNTTEVIKYNLKNEKKEVEIFKERLGLNIKKYKNNLYVLNYDKNDIVCLFEYDISTKKKEKLIDNIVENEFPLITEDKIFFSRNGNLFEYDKKNRKEKNLFIKGKFPFDYLDNDLYYYVEEKHLIEKINLISGERKEIQYEDLLETFNIHETPVKIGEKVYILNKENYNSVYLFNTELYIFDMENKFKIKVNKLYKIKKENNFFNPISYLFFDGNF